MHGHIHISPETVIYKAAVLSTTSKSIKTFSVSFEYVFEKRSFLKFLKIPVRIGREWTITDKTTKQSKKIFLSTGSPKITADIFDNEIVH
jgi:hypothetical protein